MPILYVIAGPNGIGKTTASYDLVPTNTPIINSDEIAKEVRNAGIITGNTQEYSNREAIRLMEEERAKNNSFAIETNLADVDTWKFLFDVQKTGYQIHILYMSTDNISVLNERIRERTLLGDHYVSPDVVEQRYIDGLNLLNHYYGKVDKLQLFDNSSSPRLLAEINYDEIVFLEEQLPQWANNYLGQKLTKLIETKTSIKDLQDINEVRRAYEKLKRK